MCRLRIDGATPGLIDPAGQIPSDPVKFAGRAADSEAGGYQDVPSLHVRASDRPAHRWRDLMAQRERKQPSRPGLAPRLAVVAAACLATAGCLGPAAVRSSRLRYNESIRATNDEQLLLNLVRLRYADSPI